MFKRKGYKFDGMTKRDGIGVSIILVQTDDENNSIKKPTKKELESYEKRIDPKYFDTVKVSHLEDKIIVVRYPGNSDLAMKAIVGTKEITPNFTKRQRNRDTKRSKYNNIRFDLQNEKIDGRTIKKVESDLSTYNHKICDFLKFLVYISAKNEVNDTLYAHYRKLCFNTTTNTRRSEDQMVNNFKEVFGPPEKIVVILGNYSGTHLKGTTPFLITKWRKIHGYQVYSIDEYKTSKICSCCHGHTENFVKRMHRNNKRKWEKTKVYERNSGKKRLVWKLIRCTICKSIHNRDSNARNNMIDIVGNYLRRKERPATFQRANINNSRKNQNRLMARKP